MTGTPVTDSANNPLTDDSDQAPADLDDVLSEIRSVEDPPKKKGRKKKGASCLLYTSDAADE